jgi:N-acetylneuraminate synthase
MSGFGTRVLVIAEAGVNHNGSLDRARALVDAARAAGADAVKFQSFKADRLVSGQSPKARYQQENTPLHESQLEMLRRLELGEAEHLALIEHCDQRGIRFLSSPFDLESVDLLAGRFRLPLLKIASGQISNAPLLLRAARAGAAVLVSTGMSTLGDIEAALGVLAFGYGGGDLPPSQEAFERAFVAPSSRQLLQDKVTLLHCTTEYPAPFAEVNLRAMDTLRQAFALPVGFSDHTVGIAIPLAAVARGATVIEKHFTLDRNLPGPDHQASLEPLELAAMVEGIRQVELALGDGRKLPVPSEMGNRAVARQSLVATTAIKAGEAFSEENLGFKRPGTGISPLRYWQLLGTVATRDYAPDEAIDPPGARR